MKRAFLALLLSPILNFGILFIAYKSNLFIPQDIFVSFLISLVAIILDIALLKQIKNRKQKGTLLVALSMILAILFVLICTFIFLIVEGCTGPCIS